MGQVQLYSFYCLGSRHRSQNFQTLGIALVRLTFFISAIYVLFLGTIHFWQICLWKTVAMQLWRGFLRKKPACVRNASHRILARYIYLATTIISLYKRFLRIIGYLAGLLLLIIVSHNPDFNNQFEQFQNVICPFQKSYIVITTMKK